MKFEPGFGRKQWYKAEKEDIKSNSRIAEACFEDAS